MATSSTSSQWRDLRKVLRPCNIEDDEADYPQIDISDVSVMDSIGKRTSLLLASPKNVLTITGRVSYSKALAKQFIQKPTAPAPIIYHDVASFSYDDQLELWALCHAGWLHITSSSKDYASILQSMKKVVEQIYFIMENKDEDWNMRDWATHWKDENGSSKMTLERAAFSFAGNADVFHLETDKKFNKKSKNTIIYRYLKEAALSAAECRAQGKIVVNQAASSKHKSAIPAPGPHTPLNSKVKPPKKREEKEQDTEEDDDETESEEDEEEEIQIPSSMLRPWVAKAGKRYTRNMGTLSEDEGSQSDSKRKKLHQEDEGLDLMRRQGAELPLRWKEANEMDLVLTGPLDANAIDEDGNWRCTQLDCLHVVYAADTDLGQELVKMHIVDHENDQVMEEMEPELDIVLKEKQATRMPVSNLLKRIREFTSARTLADAIAGTDDESPEDEEQAMKPVKRLYT